MSKSPWMIRPPVLLALLLLLGGPTGAVTAQPADPDRQALADGRVPPLRPPVEAPVVTPFDRSQGEFGPGVRGVKLDAPAGSLVAASAPGTVRFAGVVAGAGWVTAEVAPGVLVSAGPLDRIAVRAGEAVGARTVLGRLAASGDRELHLGLRVDRAYVDPLPHLARVGPPRLVPVHAALPDG